MWRVSLIRAQTYAGQLDSCKTCVIALLNPFFVNLSPTQRWPPPRSDGLQPNSVGLQPTSVGHVAASVVTDVSLLPLSGLVRLFQAYQIIQSCQGIGQQQTGKCTTAMSCGRHRTNIWQHVLWLNPEPEPPRNMTIICQQSPCPLRKIESNCCESCEWSTHDLFGQHLWYR